MKSPKKISTKLIEPCIFYLQERCNFAANQQVSNMDVITIESKAYKEIVAKIDVIANYVFSQEEH